MGILQWDICYISYERYNSIGNSFQNATMFFTYDPRTNGSTTIDKKSVNWKRQKYYKIQCAYGHKHVEDSFRSV